MIGVLAALLLAATTTATAPEARAATFKVVIVVGPVGSQTDSYRKGANRLADQARDYGANVVKIYSPDATWSRVKDAARNANVLIYLGHGNGWPSPYAPFSESSKNGFGLNRSTGNGNSNLKYYGQQYMERLDLARNSVVILNRLCYASGNNEWGAGNPSRETAIKRVDGYGTGFFRAGAKAVFASGITSPGYVLKGLFTGAGSTTMGGLFWDDSNRTGKHDFKFESRKTGWATGVLDPYAKHRYYRSVIGDLDTTVSDWRDGG